MSFRHHAPLFSPISGYVITRNDEIAFDVMIVESRHKQQAAKGDPQFSSPK